MAKKRHLVYLDTKHENHLTDIIERKNLETLDSTSKLMRFIIEDYHNLITKKSNPDVRLNYISKEISMILNLVVSICDTLKVTQMTNENVLQYWQAQREVERVINENKMNKENRRKKKPSLAMQDKLSETVVNENEYNLFGINLEAKTERNDESLKSKQETQQEEVQLEFEVPSFLKPYKEKELTNDDYVEVTSNDWTDYKF